MMDESEYSDSSPRKLGDAYAWGHFDATEKIVKYLRSNYYFTAADMVESRRWQGEQMDDSTLVTHLQRLRDLIDYERKLGIDDYA